MTYNPGVHVPFCSSECRGELHFLVADGDEYRHVHSNKQRPFCSQCVEMPRATCPDCERGKHDACVGEAWDRETDSPAICRCWEWNHEEQP